MTEKQVQGFLENKIVRRPEPGRPLALIDWKQVDQFLQAQCDGASIARLIGVHPETLYDRCVAERGKEYNITHFSEYSQLKRAEGKEMLRRKQFDSAMSGDKTMQIWLGKQLLGQRDQMETTLIVPQVKILPVSAEEEKSIQTSIDALENHESNSHIHEES